MPASQALDVRTSITPVPPTADINFGRSVLLCSKPLQVLNCASIVRHLRIGEARLHVLSSSIDDADGFRTFLAGTEGYRDLFSSIAWNTDLDAAIEDFTQQPYDSVFVDDDRLRPYLLLLPHLTERLVVFEEGIGTYRTSAARELRGMRRVKWKLIAARTGCGWDFGGGRRTDVVMVSRPETFRRLNPELADKALGFPGLIDELRREPEAWRRVVLPSLGNPAERLGRVALVLATWGGMHPAELSEVAAGADVVYYKAHPHDGAGPSGDDVQQVAGSWIPAEALIEVLATICDHLTVYHHSSSAAFYTDGLYDDTVDTVDLHDSDQLRDILAAVDD